MTGILSRRRALMMAAEQQDGVVFVDYIESDDDCWIELTDIIPGTTFGYRAILSHPQLTAGSALFGITEGDGKRLNLSGNANKLHYFGYENHYTVSSNSPVIEWGVPFIAQFNYRNDGKAYINDTEVGSVSVPSGLTWPFVVLGFRGSSGYSGRNNRLYEIKITTGTNVSHDLQPCYKRLSGDIGLYDLTTSTFYGKSGSGSLTKGRNLFVNNNIGTGVSEMLAVAASYLGQTSIEYTSYHTPILQTTPTNGIVCSTYVIFALLGIPFEDAPYNTGNYGPFAIWANTEDYDWAFDPILYTISRWADNSDPDRLVRSASAIGRWLYGRCKEIDHDNGFVDVEPGDLVFFARKDAGGDWHYPNDWKHINHVAIVSSVEPAPDTYSYTSSGETVTIPWDKAKYPYKHTYMDCGETMPPCRNTRYLELGQQDYTNMTGNTGNTVCLILRPNFS